MKDIDVLLINPYWSVLSEGIEHLGLGYMAAVLRKKGFSTVIIDAPVNGWNNEQTLSAAREYCPSLIGISIPFQDGAPDAFELICQLKKYFSCHITLGGIYPTFEYEPILSEYVELDSIVLGEGEETIADLAGAVKNNMPLENINGLAIRSGSSIVKTDTQHLVEDLDSLPFPARDTLDVIMEKYNFASIVSSRGCYGRCSFCSVDGFYSSYGPKYRFRSAKNVVDEIEMLYEDYNVHNIMFNDANFIGGITRGRERAYEIAYEILKRNLDLEFRIQCRANDVDSELFKVLKKAGLSRVYIGIESGSQPQLDRYNKDILVEDNIKALSILNDLDLFAKVGFIMFDRDVTFDDLLNNIAFIKKIKTMFKKDSLGYIYPISKLAPLAGSKVKEELYNQGMLKGDYKYYSYDFKDKKVQFFYNLIQKSSRTIWGIKSKFEGEDPDAKDWTRGWKVWEDSNAITG